MKKIRFCSPIQSHMGYAEMARCVINRLVLAGFDVSVVPISMQESQQDFGPRGRLALSLVKDEPSLDVNIVNMVPMFFSKFKVPGALNIGFTTFEADRIPDDWVRACNQMDRIWVTSEFCLAAFLNSGVTVPISVVGADTGNLTPEAAPTTDQFRFLSIFQWSARKNPSGLIRAYCAAFDGKKDVVLTIKTHRSANPAETKRFVSSSLNDILAGIKCSARPKIEVITDFCSQDQIYQLYRKSHAYVSLSHAEGFGLPAFEAVMLGRPTLHTGWSAPAEFIPSEGKIKYNLTPIFGMEEFVPFFNSSMRWAEPHLDDTISKMISLKNDYSSWKASVDARAGSLLVGWSETELAKQMRDLLA